MTDSADPRIALMQKWSAENPELLAQAGLASAVEKNSDFHLGFTAVSGDHHKDVLRKDPKVYYQHSKHVHTQKKNNATFTTKEVEVIARAVKAGAIGGNTPSTHSKKKTHHVKYYNLTPEVLSQHTDHSRDELVNTVSNAKTIKMMLITYFKDSDLLDEAKKILDHYEKFYISNSEKDFEEVYSRLFILSHRYKRITSNEASIPTGARFKNQDFHVYGPETRPIMQKAFIIKTLYHIMFKRYTKTIPPIKKQTPQQSATVKGMLDQFKRIDKPYKDLYDYGRALRIKKAEAKSAKKEFPDVHNASLRSEFDDSQNTFSMATPYT